MPKLIKTWEELVGLESDEYRLEIDVERCRGHIIRKSTNENVEYLNTHTFYSGMYKWSTYQLQKCGFDIQLKNWDGKTEEVNCGDQWEHEGRCDLCRKQKYCKNECKASKKRTEQFLRAAVMKRLLGRK